MEGQSFSIISMNNNIHLVAHGKKAVYGDICLYIVKTTILTPSAYCWKTEK